jgi:hypothetical protein
MLNLAQLPPLTFSVSVSIEDVEGTQIHIYMSVHPQAESQLAFLQNPPSIQHPAAIHISATMKLIGTTLAFAAYLATANAHASMTQPRNRGQGDSCPHCVGISSVPSNPGCPDCIPGTLRNTQGPCGQACGPNYNQPGSSWGEVVETYTAGETIDVNFSWVATHGGWHQLRICPDPSLNSVYMNSSYLPTQDDHDAIEACMNTNPITEWMWLGDSGAPASVSATIPADLECEHCLLGWRWDAWMSGNEVYTQCADIRITGGSGSPPVEPPVDPEPPVEPPTGPCVPMYQQCGGNGMATQECYQGTCTGNEYYMQCL